eukprot:scaffold2570_cov223-Alexandrium_tamarense.AAC.7
MSCVDQEYYFKTFQTTRWSRTQQRWFNPSHFYSHTDAETTHTAQVIHAIEKSIVLRREDRSVSFAQASVVGMIMVRVHSPSGMIQFILMSSGVVQGHSIVMKNGSVIQ